MAEKQALIPPPPPEYVALQELQEASVIYENLPKPMGGTEWTSLNGKWILCSLSDKHSINKYKREFRSFLQKAGYIMKPAKYTLAEKAKLYPKAAEIFKSRNNK